MRNERGNAKRTNKMSQNQNFLAHNLQAESNVIAVHAIVMAELVRMYSDSDKSVDAATFTSNEKNVKEAIRNVNKEKETVSGKSVWKANYLNTKNFGAVAPLFKARLFSNKLLKTLVDRFGSYNELYKNLAALETAFKAVGTISAAFGLSRETKANATATVCSQFGSGKTVEQILTQIFADSLNLSPTEISPLRHKSFLEFCEAHNAKNRQAKARFSSSADVAEFKPVVLKPSDAKRLLKPITVETAEQKAAEKAKRDAKKAIAANSQQGLVVPPSI